MKIARPAPGGAARASVLSAVLLAPLTVLASCEESPTDVREQQAFELAFASDRGGTIDLHLLAGDGTGVTQLTNDWAVERMYEWAPDGG